MLVLGIESSCDETAVAVVESVPAAPATAPRVLLRSNWVDSQVARHAPFGGVVPEIASREHLARLPQLLQAAVTPLGGMAAIEGIAVTCGPGLVGALLVGVQFAKGLALARGLPWVGVNHLEAHLCAAHLAAAPPAYPYVALLVSGGHTQLYAVHGFAQYRMLGQTRDDAAGEAFDKIAKMLGLGYPGGARIEALARQAIAPAALSVPLPQALRGATELNFSFSGLKTAAARQLQASAATPPCAGQALANFCAAVQEAICTPLIDKAIAAAQQNRLPGIVLAGGVAANGYLRHHLAARAAAAGLWSFAPPPPLCTDNAAMVAAAGLQHLQRGARSAWSLSVRSRWPLAA